MTYTLEMTQNTHNGTHKIVHEQMSHPHTQRAHVQMTHANGTHKHAQNDTQNETHPHNETRVHIQFHTIHLFKTVLIF